MKSSDSCPVCTMVYVVRELSFAKDNETPLPMMSSLVFTLMPHTLDNTNTFKSVL